MFCHALSPGWGCQVNIVCPGQYLVLNNWTKKLLAVYLKLKFNWVSCIEWMNELINSVAKFGYLPYVLGLFARACIMAKNPKWYGSQIVFAGFLQWLYIKPALWMISIFIFLSLPPSLFSSLCACVFSLAEPFESCRHLDAEASACISQK